MNETLIKLLLCLQIYTPEDYASIERYILCVDHIKNVLEFRKVEQECSKEEKELSTPDQTSDFSFADFITQAQSFTQPPITTATNEENTDIMGSTDACFSNFSQSESQSLCSETFGILDIPNNGARLFPNNLNLAVAHIAKIGNFQLIDKETAENVSLYVRKNVNEVTILANVCNDMSKEDIGFIKSGNLGPAELISAINSSYNDIENNRRCQVLFPMVFSTLGHYMVIEIDIKRTNNHSAPQIELNIHDSMSGLSGALFKFAVENCSSAVNSFIQELKNKFKVDDVTLTVKNDFSQRDSHNCGRHVIYKMLYLSDLLLSKDNHRQDILLIGEFFGKAHITDNMLTFLAKKIKAIEAFKATLKDQITTSSSSSYSSPMIPTSTKVGATGFVAQETERRNSLSTIENSIYS